MEIFGLLFEICYSLMLIEIPLFGFHITLFNVFVYSVIGYVLLRLVFSLFDKE